MNKFFTKQDRLNGVSPKDFLTSKFGEPEIVFNEKNKCSSWNTPYKVSFQIHDKLTDFIYYKYDQTLQYYPHEKSTECDGLVEKLDLPEIFEKLETNPNMLNHKSPSIIIIENYVEGVEAKMKLDKLGAWHLYIHDYAISFFNNPFNLTTGYTDRENVFEIWFRKEDKNPLEYVGLKQVMKMFSQRGLMKKQTPTSFIFNIDFNLCSICQKSNTINSISLLQCSKCKNIKYCSRDCQLKGWSIHKRYCCK